MNGLGKEVTIVMIEDDEGHARLIEKNIRRAGVSWAALLGSLLVPGHTAGVTQEMTP